MRILGVRVAPKVASFVVYCTEEEKLMCVDVIKIPLMLSTPERLRYIRNNILDIIREYNVSVASIRISETIARSINIDRLYIEGVIQETFASSNISSYYTLRKNSICSRLNIDMKSFDAIVSGKSQYMDIDMAKYDINTREAILAAMSAGGIV